ncbi:MAG: hypothetical protein JWL97_647, partial [Gemmatimonadales bacterium]|nr:hypothetical protein [Gemmatimonadales bacterium]
MLVAALTMSSIQFSRPDGAPFDTGIGENLAGIAPGLTGQWCNQDIAHLLRLRSPC